MEHSHIPTAPKLAALADAVVLAHRMAAPVDGEAATRYLYRQMAATLAGLAEARDVFPTCRSAAFGTQAAAFLDRAEPLLRLRSARGLARCCRGRLPEAPIAPSGGGRGRHGGLGTLQAAPGYDVLYDLAAVLVELCRRGRRDAASGLLNRYLWLSERQDRQIAGLALLPLFLALRAAARAALLAAQWRREPAHLRLRRQAQADFGMALRLLQPSRPLLVALGGLPGTGKSTLAAALAPALGRAPGALVLHSELQRKRLLRARETARLGPEAYRPEVSARVYEELMSLAHTGLAAGRAVIVDATHQWPGIRTSVARSACRAGAPFVGLWLEAPTAQLAQRLAARRGGAVQAIEAELRAQAALATGTVSWHRLDATLAPAELAQSALHRIAGAANAGAALATAATRKRIALAG